MSTPLSPLLFETVLHAPGLWRTLGSAHGLSEKDFKWLGHVQLATQTLREQQTPPMLAQRIVLGSKAGSTIALAGSFLLSATPDDHAVMLYTPFDGLKKFDDFTALTEHLEQRLKEADERDTLLAFLGIAQRKRLVEDRDIRVSFEGITGDVFDDQRAAIQQGQQLNAQAMLDELKKLPSLVELLDVLLAQQPAADPPQEPQRHAVVSAMAGKLTALLYTQMELFWNAPSADGTTRRAFFAQALAEQARADFLLKREGGIIDAEKCANLLSWLGAQFGTGRRATLETVRLWEYQANYVELAGSLMISHTDACLYTPSQGLQVLKDYKDLKDTLLSKFKAAGHEDELYGLLNLEERQRFLGYDQPHVSGEPIAGDIFQVLFEAILIKQRQNIDYALQVFRHSDGEVDIAALFDKALDIRSMIHERLLALDSEGRWSTRPILSGSQLPSLLRADAATAEVKKFAGVLLALSGYFSSQPVSPATLQRSWLEAMKPQLAHAFFVGITGEARLRVMNGSWRHAERAIVEAVFHPARPDRADRVGLNGFRPDVFSLTVEPSAQAAALPLAHCVVMTERGGLDLQHSGRAVLWTPALGLEVFRSIEHFRAEMNRRLRDSQKRLTLLENLAPGTDGFHQRYSLGYLRLISGNVLEASARSAINHFLARAERLRQLKLPKASESKALNDMTTHVIDANLHRATALARSIATQHSLPAWLGMAALDDQHLHLELLEQWRHSVTDDKDYLHGLPTLRDYLQQTLKTQLDRHFAGQTLDPDTLTITPTLALAGPALSLTDFALNLSHIAQNIQFSVSANGRVLPAGLNQQLVRSLLRSLDIASTFANKITAALSAQDSSAQSRKHTFFRQVPWQLLQHAHQLKLQQQLSDKAFDLISQVLDMPDAIARASVAGAHAIMRPLELIKTAGANAVKALGLYLIGPKPGQPGPQVLWAPYHGELGFHEFENEAAAIARLNLPGALQDLLIRRLPAQQQSVFSNLFKASLAQTSEMTFASNPLRGNWLEQFFSDHLKLLPLLLGCHATPSALTDWEAAKNLFSAGIKRVSGLLPGKLAYLPFLWHSYEDFKDSAEGLQDQHWQRAIKGFIAGAAELVSLGRLSLESTLDTEAPAPSVSVTPQAATPPTVSAPDWPHIRVTAPERTALHTFEQRTLALKDLSHDPLRGTYYEPTSRRSYAAIAGKVYAVTRPGAVWQILGADGNGPTLRLLDSRQWLIDGDQHTVHYGKAMSKMYHAHASEQEARLWLNIEAQGMEEIRRIHPEKARMLTQAVDMSRFYAFNSLHNLAQLKNHVPGTRLDRFLKTFFDVKRVDADLLAAIKQAIVPICNALVDPTDDLLNTERFVVGTNRYRRANLTAFVMHKDSRRYVHFTELFFQPKLDWYKSGMTEPFDVDGHAQASTLIHELSHQLLNAVDITYLEARRPFADLIATTTGYGAALKANQTQYQREALSLLTPREELFARWSHALQAWIGLDETPGSEHVAKEILKTTLSRTLADARTAFLNPVNPKARVDTILRNADSVALLICEMGRQLDPATQPTGVLT